MILLTEVFSLKIKFFFFKNNHSKLYVYYLFVYAISFEFHSEKATLTDEVFIFVFNHAFPNLNHGVDYRGTSNSRNHQIFKKRRFFLLKTQLKRFDFTRFISVLSKIINITKIEG